MRKLCRCLWRTRPEQNAGYLLLRVFTGIGIFTHGLPKLTGGVDHWAELGSAVTATGFPGPAVFWGFMSAFAEGICSILLLMGLLTRGAAFLLVVNMAVAVLIGHRGDPFALRELGSLYFFITLLFLLKGAGSYSIDRWLSLPTKTSSE